MKTNLCHMLGIEHPIIAAPLGPDLTGPDLVAAVSNAGGLGILQAQFCSPPVFRQEIRLQGGGELSLAEVALHAGFSDQSQFSRHFKRLVGVTPGQFRTPSRIA